MDRFYQREARRIERQVSLNYKTFDFKGLGCIVAKDGRSQLSSVQYKYSLRWPELYIYRLSLDQMFTELSEQKPVHLEKKRTFPRVFLKAHKQASILINFLFQYTCKYGQSTYQA